MREIQLKIDIEYRSIMLDDLPNDILRLIFRHLWMKDIHLLRRVSKNLKDFVDTSFARREITMRSENFPIENVHIDDKISVEETSITIEDVSIYRDVYSLNLGSLRKITDVSALGGVHTLDLS
jgi:hypothetical protein